MQYSKLIRFAVRVGIKGLMMALIGVSASVYKPVMAEAPIRTQEGWDLPNIQTLLEHPLANKDFIPNETQELKFYLYIKSIYDFDLTYKEFKKLNEVVHLESTWRPNVYGDKGLAFSLAQFHEKTFNWFKKMSGFENLDYKNPKDQLTLLAWAYKNKLMSHWTTWAIAKTK
jgi:hypothetical protein